MANKKAKLNDSNGGGVGYLQTVRIPFFNAINIRNVGGYLGGADVVLENVYLEEVEEKNIGTKKYRAIKRPAISVGLGPFTGSSFTSCYGMYYRNNKLYYATDNGIYSINLATLAATQISKGLVPSNIPATVSFKETHPDAPTPYLTVTDGTQLHCIDSSDVVTVLNNVAINTSSVAAATVITTATNHNLITGNKVVIRNHAGSTPSLNGIAYTVTVLTPTTFSIPVTVTVAGAGGTIGVFPTNVGDLEFMNGYLFVGNSNGRIYNCDYNDPTSWQTTSYITCLMQNDTLTALGRQNNYIIAFKGATTQFFYDSGNSIIGQTPLANAEQTMQQIGCSSRASSVSTANTAYWVGNAKTGGYTIFSLDGTSKVKEIGIGPINRLIQQETNNIYNGIESCVGNLITVNGYTYYMLHLPLQQRVAVYNEQNETWTLWFNPYVGSFYNWPTFFIQIPKTAYTSDSLYCGFIENPNKMIFIMQYGTGQDTSWDNTNVWNILVRLATNAIDLDTNKRKFWERMEIIGDNWGTTGTITIQYADYDNNAITSPGASRIFNISSNIQDNRFSSRAWGNSRRRMWGIVHDSPVAGTRYEAFEGDVRIGEF